MISFSLYRRGAQCEPDGGDGGGESGQDIEAVRTPLEPIRRVYPRGEDGQTLGRPTIWLRGGWRCSNGAGGAICFNARDDSFNVIDSQGADHDFAITATVR